MLPSDKEKFQVDIYCKKLRHIFAHRTASSAHGAIQECCDLLLRHYKDQRRSWGELSILHPLRVAYIVAEDLLEGPIDILAALLHDVVHDTQLELAAVEQRYGSYITQIVQRVTELELASAAHYQKHKTIPLKMLFEHFTTNSHVLFIKMADTLDNLRMHRFRGRKERKQTCYEAKQIYSRIAGRLGLNDIKDELQELHLKFAQPKAYHQLKNKLEVVYQDADTIFDSFLAPIQERLVAHRLPFRIQKRLKSIHSTHQKMQQDKISIKDIYDLFAMRIILDCPRNDEKMYCWQIYGMIADLYPIHPQRTRDWINTPRTNGYESLHMTVMAPVGKWIEVQIRTERMHEVAANGVAAHWRYKEQGLTQESYILDGWMQQFKDLMQLSDTKEAKAMQHLKEQLFAKEISVLSNTGKTTNLPQGATVLDYAIRMQGVDFFHYAKILVNRTRVPLHHVLEQHDEVNLLPFTREPKRGWLKKVTTPHAYRLLTQLLAARAKRPQAHRVMVREAGL